MLQNKHPKYTIFFLLHKSAEFDWVNHALGGRVTGPGFELCIDMFAHMFPHSPWISRFPAYVLLNADDWVKEPSQTQVHDLCLVHIYYYYIGQSMTYN